METNLDFDKIRYISLLKKDKRYLSNENREELDELESYQVILENQIYYTSRAKYISLVEAFLVHQEKAGEAGARMFQWDFFSLFREDNEALGTLEKEILKGNIERLNSFSINPKSTEFSTLINTIAGCCECLTFNPTDAYGISLNRFELEMEKIFLQMKEYSDKE